MPQVQTASYWASRVAHVVALSRSAVLAYMRRRASWPASRLDEGRPHQRDLLRDEAADGEAEQVGLADPHRGREGDGIAGHLLDGVRAGAGGAADSGVVERHD